MNENKRWMGAWWRVGVACFSSACAWNTAAPEESRQPSESSLDPTNPGATDQGLDMGFDRDFEFRRQMRVLWEGRVSFTRLYIVSALADLPDTAYVASRLTKNHVDMGEAIKPYYGEAIGDEFARVLYEYEEGAKAFLVAARGENPPEIKHAYIEWRKHADQVARYLAAINPHWKEADWKLEMQTHLELTRSEISARLSADWKGDLVINDLAVKQALRMSDMLSVGVAKQFPHHTE